jgi:NADH-ubiquinone oxidoreductase chain 6
LLIKNKKRSVLDTNKIIILDKVYKLNLLIIIKKKVATKMTTLFLNFLSIGTLLSGILTITAKNPVISVIYLIFTFVLAAGYLILIGIQFIGISYIIVYVGAIAVLFLFVIMMINIKLTDILETGTQYTKNLPLAISIGSLFLYLFYNIIPFNFNNIPSLLFASAKSQLNILNYYNLFIAKGNAFISIVDNLAFSPIYNNALFANNDYYILNFLQIEVLGHTLYTYAAILLIILSFILLLAMFATIVLSKKN